MHVEITAIFSFSKNWYHCPHESSTSCTFYVREPVEHNHFRIDEEYFFMLRANNSLAAIQTDCSDANKCLVETKYLGSPSHSRNDTQKVPWTIRTFLKIWYIWSAALWHCSTECHAEHCSTECHAELAVGSARLTEDYW